MRATARAGLAGTVGAAGLAAVLAPGLVAQDPAWRCPEPTELAAGFDGALAHVRYLADDRLEGRAVATRGERCAGDYLAGQFAAIGLAPAGEDGSYFQAWEVRTGSAAGTDLRLALEHGSSAVEYALHSEWIPYGFSASATVRGPLAAATVAADQLGAATGHDLNGKVLVVAESPDPHQVASTAARMGVVAVIVLLAADDPLPALSGERRAALSVPVVAVRGRAAAEVRDAAEGGDAPAWASLSVDVTPVRREARNVTAVLRGSGASGRVPSLIVGAHYDHLGFGGEGSLSPDATGTVHNGADDNASGTAVVLEVARRLTAGPPLSRDVVFIAFTGEERGLWGSAHYVESPLVPLESVEAMLNLDMVGRVQNDALTVFGTATAEEWPSVVERANRRTATPLDLQLVGDGFGASDHSSFYARGIPVLHFFSNTHPEYHRVEDDWELVNADGMERVADLVAAVVGELAPANQVAAALTPVEGAGNPHGATAPGDGSTVRSGFRVRVGTIPDYSRESGGMGITGVRDGSPAAKAGLKGGDVIVRFGDHQVEDVYGYMYALQEFEPGDEVEVVVLRDGEQMTLVVVLEAGGD